MERIGFLEKVVGDHSEEHGQALREALMKLEQLHNNFHALEGDHRELMRAHGILASERAELDAKHASTSERVGLLERVLGDSTDRHDKELGALKDLHALRMNDIKLTQTSLQVRVAQEKEAKEQHHADVTARLSSIENALGQDTDRQAKELEALMGIRNKMPGGLATVPERLDHLEKLMCGHYEKHALDPSSAHGRIEHTYRFAVLEPHG